MTDTKKNEEAKGDEILRRMLKTPPDPHKPSESKPGQNKKPDDDPAKKRRPARI